MKGITFNSKHSFSDFNLILNSKKISTPSKKKIKVDVPFMNGSYDFSTIGSSGEIIYNLRTIDVKFTLLSYSKAKLHSDLTKIVQWLQDIGQSQLVFDDIKDYYFLAEIEESIEIIEYNNTAEITVKFIAEPFKTGVDYAVNNLCDIFNFEEDYLQVGYFIVDEILYTTLYNPGRIVSPTISSSGDISITFNDKTYDLVAGDNKFYDLKFANGANEIIINGSGIISFIFRKQVL